MKITEVHIKNYRLLYNIRVALNQEITSIVGKNNSGKTSLTTIFKSFWDRRSFAFEDFSIESYSSFLNVCRAFQQEGFDLEEAQKEIPKIQMYLTVQYTEKDNWSHLRPFLTSLEPSDTIEILFEFAPDSTLIFLKEIYNTDLDLNEDAKLIERIKDTYARHYSIKFYPVSDTETSFVVKHADIRQLFNAKFIHAQRGLDDSSEESRSKLSHIFQNQFNLTENEDVSSSADLVLSINNASNTIDQQLDSFFAPFIDSFEVFGFPGMGSERINLRAELKPETLFRNNVKLFYNQNGENLPEKFNGLGYSNLIFIISEIIGFCEDAKQQGSSVNVIFIEEPEAHMHPQMQSVFIKNVNTFLQSQGIQAQVVITTHSSHILSDSPFETIRYFLRCSESCATLVKDLAAFKLNPPIKEGSTDDIKEAVEKAHKETIEFLEQYLTLGKCDLFFADKAIFFEGTVERILLPRFIAKDEPKLSQQFVTSIEVGGTYMYYFRQLLDFIELKTLIITDIDSISLPSRKKTVVALGEEQMTSNETLKQWLPAKESIDELLAETIEKTDGNKTRVAYQTLVSLSDTVVRCGRSFEEAFILENSEYLFNNKDDFKSIKYQLKGYTSAEEIRNDSFEIQEFIDRNKRKTDFTFELLTIKQEDWNTPTYIKEGLQWLTQ